MKCRERNSEKTALKVEKTEGFWNRLREIVTRVIDFNEKGIIVDDGLRKEFVEYGDYIIVSKDNYLNCCNKDDFERLYDVIDDNVKEKTCNNAECAKEEISKINDKIKCLEKSLENISSKKMTVNVEELINTLEENIKKSLKIADSFFSATK